MDSDEKKTTKERSSKKKDAVTKGKTQVGSKSKTVKKKTAIKKSSTITKKKLSEDTNAVSTATDNEPAYASINHNNDLIIKQTNNARYLVQMAIIVILAIVALFLVFNRTFLKSEYSNNYIQISIPKFSYFVNDSNNEVKFITLRKSEYLRNYFNEYLEGFVFYSCNNSNTKFYYDSETNTVINSIEVVKNFAMKTVIVKYSRYTPDQLCSLDNK